MIIHDLDLSTLARDLAGFRVSSRHSRTFNEVHSQLESSSFIETADRVFRFKLADEAAIADISKSNPFDCTGRCQSHRRADL